MKITNSIIILNSIILFLHILFKNIEFINIAHQVIINYKWISDIQIQFIQLSQASQDINAKLYTNQLILTVFDFGFQRDLNKTIHQKSIKSKH